MNEDLEYEHPQLRRRYSTTSSGTLNRTIILLCRDCLTSIIAQQRRGGKPRVAVFATHANQTSFPKSGRATVLVLDSCRSSALILHICYQHIARYSGFRSTLISTPELFSYKSKLQPLNNKDIHWRVFVHCRNSTKLCGRKESRLFCLIPLIGLLWESA